MDVSRAKFKLAVWILLSGMLLALAWHGWQGWVLHRGYPHNTFLDPAKLQHEDFGGQENYFPANHLVLEVVKLLPRHQRFLIYMIVVEGGLFALLLVSLRPLFPHPGWRTLATLPFLLSFPNLFGIDRGNSEIMLALLIGLSLLWYQQRRYALSWGALLAPICFKFYPVVLSLLFFRRRLLHWFVLMPVAFALITGWCVAIFRAPVGPGAKSEHPISYQIAAYMVRNNLDQDGVSSDASAWNLARIAVWTVRSAWQHSFHWPLPFVLTVHVLEAYYCAMLVIGVILTLHLLFTEKSWARRAVLLLLYLTVSLPGGGSYKLMHALTALIVYILIRERHRFDRAVTVLLAVAVLPKREMVLHFVGPSDTHFRDAGLGVLINPICLLLAMFLMAWAAYAEGTPLSFRQQIGKLAAILHVR